MRLNSKVASLDLKLIKRAPGVTVPDIVNRDSNLHGRKRYRIADAFREFVWKTVPKIEERVEETILRDLFSKMKSETLKDEVMQAYKRRRMNIESKGFHEQKVKPNPDEPAPLERPNVDVSFHDINLTSEEMIGMWCVIDPRNFSRIFPKGCFGTYYKDDVSQSKIFSMSCSKESVYLINILKNIQSSMTEGESFVEKYITDRQNSLDFDDSLNQFDIYHKIYKVFADELRACLVPHRNNTFVDNKLGDNFYFDIILNLLMRHFAKTPELRQALAVKENRKIFFQDLTKQILEKSVEEFASFRNPSVWLGDLKELTFTLPEYKLENGKFVATNEVKTHKISTKPYLDHLSDLPEAIGKYGMQKTLGFNSGIMLHGGRGTGKSGILNYVTTWAWHNNWIVLKIPSAHRLTQVELRFVRHEESRMYMQPQLTREVLEDIALTNSHLILDMPINQSLYGFYNIAGVHDNEPAAVQNTYDEWTETHLFDSDKFLLEGEHQSNLNEQREWKIRLKEKLPAPKTIRELIAFADKEPDYTTAVLAEVLEQIRHQEKYPVLIVCDDYNWFFRRTVFPSFRYDNKFLKGFVPAYHMSLCRMFMRMDGHKFKNGFKLVASSHYHLYKHEFTPEKINYPEGFDWKMNGIALDQFRNAIYHYCNTNLFKENNIGEDLIQQYYVEAQGRWGNLLHYIHKRYDCIDINDYKLDRSIIFDKY